MNRPQGHDLYNAPDGALEQTMKKIVIALVAALPLLAFAPAAHAGDQNPQHVCGTPQKPCGNWKTQWVPTGEHDWEWVGWKQKPKYKPVRKFVPAACQGKCPKQQPEVVNVPPAEPKTVIREQVINVVTVSRVVYHPAPVVNVAPAPCAVANPCQRSVNPCAQRNPCQQNFVPQHYSPQQPYVNASLNPGVPGGGYVDGAPRSPQECLQRGGFDTGQGCRGYR